VPDRGGERGMALVVALLILCLLSTLGATLMASLGTERKIVGHAERSAQALDAAEAGVGEALARIRSGEIRLPESNPRAAAQIFLCREGGEPRLGPDSTSLATRQPDGAWLDYSAAGRGEGALTVSFKTDAAGASIYRYDGNLLPPLNTRTGLPVYVIRSTGRVGGARERIVTEVIQKPIEVQLHAALGADTDIEFGGNAAVCGHDHLGSTPDLAGANGRERIGSCVPYETGISSLPGSWTTGSTRGGGGPTRAGVPEAGLSSQSGFYAGPWEALGMERGEFYAWLGAAERSEPRDLVGVVHLDRDAIPQDRSGGFVLRGVRGEGMLYVDGDLTLRDDFVYRGLIYVEGDLKVEGRAWILGGLVVCGKARLKLDGGTTVLYSREAITRALASHGGQFTTLSWRQEQPGAE
jgi:hypothetical protein